MRGERLAPVAAGGGTRGGGSTVREQRCPGARPTAPGERPGGLKRLNGGSEEAAAAGRIRRRHPGPGAALPASPFVYVL